MPCHRLPDRQTGDDVRGVRQLADEPARSRASAAATGSGSRVRGLMGYSPVRDISGVTRSSTLASAAISSPRQIAPRFSSMLSTLSTWQPPRCRYSGIPDGRPRCANFLDENPGPARFHEHTHFRQQVQVLEVQDPRPVEIDGHVGVLYQFAGALPLLDEEAVRSVSCHRGSNRRDRLLEPPVGREQRNRSRFHADFDTGVLMQVRVEPETQPAASLQHPETHLDAVAVPGVHAAAPQGSGFTLGR